MAQPTIAQDAQQITTNGGVAYSTSDTQIKYRTINQGSPLSHDNVDANFEIFRKAINGLVADITAINVDIDGVVDKDISSVMSGVTLSYSSNGQNYGIRKSGTNLYVNVPWSNTTYSAGNGINLSGTQFTVSAGGGLSQTTSGLAHADTSSRGSVNNSGRTYIQDISLDTYGHVIGINSATESYTYSLPTASSSTLGGIKVGSRLSISNGVLSADNQSFTLPTASSSTLGGIKVGSRLSISNGVLSADNQTFSLPTASSSTLGGIKVGSGLTISSGVLSANVQSIPTASSSTLGGIKVGGGLSISSGVLSANVQSIPTASSSTLGGVKVGSGLSISSGVLSASGSIGGGGSYKTIKRFRLPFVGNKYATSGYMIDAADDNFDGIADTTTPINGGIGHGTTARDGAMTTGLYIVAVYYPGSSSNWYTLNMGNGFNATAEKNFHAAMGNVTLNNPGFTNPVCGSPAGTSSTTTLNYKYGNGQSVCLQTGSSTTWVRFRSDGIVDLHLRSGNSASWSYMVLTCFQYQ